MNYKSIFSIDDHKDVKGLFGKVTRRVKNDVDILNGISRKELVDFHDQRQKVNKGKYLATIYAIPVYEFAEHFREKAKNKFGLTRQAEVYLNNAMSQLTILIDKLANQTFTIEDVEKFVDDTDSADDWNLYKLLIKLVYDHSKREEVATIEDKNNIIADKDIALDSFREREELRKSRQNGRAEITSKALRDKANRNALSLKPVFQEINEAGFTTLRDMAEELNRRQVACLKGGHKWFPTTVKAVKDRILVLESQDIENQSVY